VKLLLDTHAFIYAILTPEKLSNRVRGYLEDLGVERAVSVVSLWEIALKTSLDKLVAPRSGDAYVAYAADLTAQWVAVEARHSFPLFSMPLKHKDPFDRLLIAQALVDGYTLVSKDRHFKQYGVPVIW
jgi:PIN domain nuclease of toxin-antitoxin system